MRFLIQLASGSARSSRDMAKAILACKNPIFDPQSNRSPEKRNPWNGTLPIWRASASVNCTSLPAPRSCVTNEEEFNKKIEENLGSYYVAESEKQLEAEINKVLEKNHKLTLPDDFLKRWLQGTKPDTYNKDNPTLRKGQGWVSLLGSQKYFDYAFCMSTVVKYG